MDKAESEKLKAQYPNEELTTVVSPDDGIEIVIRAPATAVLLKYDTMAKDFGDPVKRVQAQEFLVLQSMVHPDPQTFRAELDRRRLTGFYAVAVDEILLISGRRNNIQVGKL